MNAFRTITIKGKERWDNISYQQYGTPDLIGKLIEANPELQIFDVIPPGTSIRVPIIAENDVWNITKVKSPWA